MSREPEILKSIIDDTEYNKTPQSRNEEILLSILNDTEYTKTPQSREEELLLELKDKIGHGITVEPLSVTENGTYTAPEGTAYSPVEVDVPIPPSPSPSVKSGVTFYDYDGTTVANYTKEQFLALTELPANPTHERLVAQGWNYSLTDAKAYVTKYGVLNVGQMYTTASGALEIDIELHEGRLHPYLGLNINGSVTVDWGDGTATDTMTGSSLSTVVRKDHVYSASGAYTIKVFADDGTSVAIVGGNGFSNILTHSTSPSQNSPTNSYNLSVVKIYITNFTSIDNTAFQNCSSLASVTIPDSITSIGSYAFYGCNNLTSITIPDSVTSIIGSAFQNCYSLTSITIPHSVTNIGSYVFNNCYSLTSVTIPDSVTIISNYIFQNCSSLASITIPDSITSIGSYAFYNCPSLVSIIISDGVMGIDNNVFQGCTALASITIPDSVKHIGNDVFSGCHSLTSVTIPDSVTSIGSYVFSNCYSLTSVTIPDSVTNIGSYAFQNCRSLTSVTIPDGVMSISSYVLNGCQALASITIQDSVTSINNSAFASCRSLGFIKFEPKTPPTVSSGAWSSVPTDCIIYVPTGTIETYKATANMPNPSTYTYVEY